MLYLIDNKNTDEELHAEKAFLHENFTEILFESKDRICNSFDDVRGTFFIDHLSISIINKENKITIFSTTPSVEYNLFLSDLWRFDKSYSLAFQIKNRFYSWEKAYDSGYFCELKNIKETDHGFTFGFNLSKKYKSIHVVYSFATRESKPNYLEYYRQYIDELFAVGDYVFRSVKAMYEKRVEKIIPEGDGGNVGKIVLFTPLFRLIINKQRDH